MTQATDIVRQALELAQKHTHISALDYQVYADALDKLTELERVENAKLRQIHEPVTKYMTRYMLDEIDSPDNCCAGEQQHKDAIAVKEALALLADLERVEKGVSLEREYTDKDIEVILKISNAAIKRNGIMKDALKAISANPYGHSEDINCAKTALFQTESQNHE